MPTIHNPIIPGFNPDPSVCRALEVIDGKLTQVFYLATSTFEWFPGVSIYRSLDLANWELVIHPLDTTELLDIRGCLDSGGSWAPDLTYNEADGLFYLVYSDVKVTQGRFKDALNYLTTAPSIMGPWSKPVSLINSGFDAAMFHEDDKSYLLNVYWDHREFSHPFAGIQLTEYDRETRALKLETSKIIWQGTQAGFTEGPHIYKLDTPNGKYYYLFAAEGGTGWTHRESVARSRELFGEYESMPEPLLTAINHPEREMQKCGHASLFQWVDETTIPNDITSGKWYIAHLSSRQLRGIDESVECEDNTRGWSILGRETSLQEVVWDEQGWPKVVGGVHGSETVEVPENGAQNDVRGFEKPIENFAQSAQSVQNRDHSQLIDFSKEIQTLNPHLQTLRIPFTSEIGELVEGKLRLCGRESLASRYTQALVARRWQSNSFEASTALSFNPTTYQQSAGLVLYYNSEYWTTLHVTNSGNSLDGKPAGRVLELTNIAARQERSLLGAKGAQIAIPEGIEKVWLKALVTPETYSFTYSFDGDQWQPIETDIDLKTTHFSDDYILTTHSGNFTGPFVGLFAYDCTGGRLPADFDFLDYREM